DDKEVESVGNLSQSSLTPPRQLSPVLRTRIVSQLLSSPPRQQSPTRIGPQKKTDAQNNSVSSNQLSINPILISSRMSLTSKSNLLSQFNPNRITALSLFNEMSIYQLANNMNLSMQTSATDGTQFMSSNSMILSQYNKQIL
ncbi:24343_t:CDS:2, partial [Racocetra persica]